MAYFTLQTRDKLKIFAKMANIKTIDSWIYLLEAHACIIVLHKLLLAFVFEQMQHIIDFQLQANSWHLNEKLYGT